MFVFAYAGAVLPVGAIFTALAGNPAVNPADEDRLFLLVGVATGVVFTVATRIAGALRPTPRYEMTS